MEPRRFTLNVPACPEGLVERLAPILAAQGSPPATVSQGPGGVIVFEGGTSDFMVSARAADALTADWPAWHELTSR